MSKNKKHTVKCCNCSWNGCEDGLVKFGEEGQYGDGYGGYGCPNCKTDEFLADVEKPKPQHTTGPWKANQPMQFQKDPIFWHVDVISGGVRVAQVSGIGKEAAQANAKLIEKAPKLLTTLKELIAEIETDAVPQFIKDMLAAAKKLTDEIESEV